MTAAPEPASGVPASGAPASGAPAPAAPASAIATPPSAEVGSGADARRLSRGRLDWATWPSYEAAVLGYREYWYPVAWSRTVPRDRPLVVMACGERVTLVRERGGIRAREQTHPVQERLGLVWVFIGDGEPPDVAVDIPSELLASDAVVLGRLSVRPGNWRFGAENGFDEGHAKFLHRDSLWTLRRQMPTWTRHHIEPREEGWIVRVPDEVHYDEVFPGLGAWPRPHRFRTKGRGRATVSIRLPCFLRVAYEHWQHYEWWVPIDAHRHIYLQLVSKRASRLERARFSLYYRGWVRWVFHGMFNDEDALMVDVMDAPPERLYRPDIAITEWRNHAEREHRGPPQTTTPEIERLARSGALPPSPGPARRVDLPLTHRLRRTLLRRA